MIRKPVLPVAGFDTQCLSATKAIIRELITMVGGFAQSLGDLKATLASARRYPEGRGACQTLFSRYQWGA